MLALVISINFLRHAISLTHFLRCIYNNLSGSGVDKLLYLVIALVNSSSKKGLHFVTGLFSTYLCIMSTEVEIAWCWYKWWI